MRETTILRVYYTFCYSSSPKLHNSHVMHDFRICGLSKRTTTKFLFLLSFLNAGANNLTPAKVNRFGIITNKRTYCDVVHCPYRRGYINFPLSEDASTDSLIDWKIITFLSLDLMLYPSIYIHIYIDSSITVHAYITVRFKRVPSKVTLRNNDFNKV